MTHRILVTCAALAMCAAASGASAAEDGFYLGGSLGQSNAGLRSGSVNYSNNDLGYKLIAGFRAFKLLAVEVNYVDLGSTNSGGVEAKTKGVDGFVMGFLPVPVVDIYGKVGIVSWKTNVSAADFSLHRSGSDLAYGAGVQMHFGAIAGRLEFEAFDVQQAGLLTRDGRFVGGNQTA